MPTCKNCKRRIGYRRILKSIGWLYRPVICKQCGQRHEITMGSRFLVSFLIVLPIAILTAFEFPFAARIPTYLFLEAIMILTSPFLVRYE